MADDRLQNHPLVKVIFDGSEGNSPNKQAGTNADAIFHQSNADDASQKLESSSPQVAASQQAQQPATGDVNPQSKNRYSIPVQSAPASSGMKSDVPKPPLQTQPHDKQSQPDEGSLIDQPPGAHHGTADKQNYYTSQNAHITTSEFGDGHAPRYNNEFTGVGEYSSYNPAQAASDSFHAINNCAPQLHGSGMYGGYGAESQLPPYPSIGGRNFPTPFVIGDESIGPMQTPPNPGSYAPLPTQIKSIPSPILAPREEFCDRSEALRLYNQSYTQAPTSPYDQGHQGQSRVSSYQGHNQQLSHQPYSWMNTTYGTGSTDDRFMLREWFSSVDQDNSGAISMTELKAAMDTAGDRYRVETLRLMMKIFDTDRSGNIDFDEFTHLFHYIRTMRDSFESYDNDRNQTLSLSEAQLALQRAKYQFGQKTMDSLMTTFSGAIHNGQLSFDNFLEMALYLGNWRTVFELHGGPRRGALRLNLEELTAVMAENSL